MKLTYYLIIIVCLFISSQSTAQEAGWFSLGVRNTINTFDHDGTGLGTGGQFRIRLSDRINTDWFADYITVNSSDQVRSEYFHIGWSVLYYLYENQQHPKMIQPYILAGHCFDYNVKTVIADPDTSKSRWGSAVQAGAGTHFNLSEKFDISLTCQCMIHLTKGLEAEIEGERVTIVDHHHTSLEGHLLTTFSLNYKIFRLWGE